MSSMRFLGGTFLSAFALFLWGALTVLFIPWHDAVMLKVQDEAAVLATLAQHAVNTGVYAVPVAHAEYTATTPFAMVMYRPAGMGMSPGAVMGVSFGTYWLATIVAALLLPKRDGLSYTRRVLFVVGLGVFASLVGHVQNWTWMGYSTGYTLVAIFDMLVGWTLAGLILAWLTQPRSQVA